MPFNPYDCYITPEEYAEAEKMALTAVTLISGFVALTAGEDFFVLVFLGLRRKRGREYDVTREDFRQDKLIGKG